MKTYNRKRTKVFAMRLNEDNLEEVAEWCGGAIKGTKLQRSWRVVEVWNKLTETETRVRIGEWLVEDSFGNFFMVPDRYFSDLFE
jgi:hypothetical protein